MRFHRLIAPALLAFVPLAFAACGDDDDPDTDDDGVSGSAGDGAGGSRAGSGSGGRAGSGTGGSTAGTGGDPQGGDPGVAGMGGSGGSEPEPTTCDLSGEGKERAALEDVAAGDTFKATADTVWTISNLVFVAGTLEVEPCTRFEGAKDPVGVLIIQKGGQIIAPGTADEPILFTSASAPGDRAPEDWGGLVLLGNAPIYGDGTALYEGQTGAEFEYGGDDPTDNSGVLQYVRLEYSGYEIRPDEEINGITFAGVGSGTTVDHIMVSNTADDCFEWFGGTVASSHLIANNCGDDMFDIDVGYVGEGDTWFGRTSPTALVSGDPNGFEWDGNLTGSAGGVLTNVTASNVTLCGADEAGLAANATYGMVLRELIEGAIDGLAVTGFEVGVDTRDDFGTAAAPHVTIENSVAFGLLTGLGAEDATDNDAGFDETAWFTDGTGNEVDPTTPPYTAAECIAADGPDAAVTDSGIGAFSTDGTWITGAWVDWAEN
jgi:hypothetical protein